MLIGLFLCAFNSTFAQPRLLILGDSHMVGHFGEHFHQRLMEGNRFEILSIAIGGSGSANFLYPLSNFCCGHVVRHVMPGDTLNAQGRVNWIDGNYALTGQLILPQYHSQLDSVLKDFSPDAVIIELGNNMINAHQQLLDRIHAYGPNMTIFWVGPYARQFARYRISEIKKVCVPFLNRCLYLRSDDLIGHDSLVTAHFGGKQAQVWADSIAARFDRLYSLRTCMALPLQQVWSCGLFSLQTCRPFLVPFVRQVIRYCPADGWLAHALLEKA